MKHTESRQVRDNHDPRFKNVGNDMEARKKIVAEHHKRHVALNPQAAGYTCEHGSYVGANGALADMFCPYSHD